MKFLYFCLKVGGTPAVLKYLHQKGFIHGDCMTVTGKFYTCTALPDCHR